MAVLQKLQFIELARGSYAEGSVGYSPEDARGATTLVLTGPDTKDLQDLPTVLHGGVDLKPLPANKVYGGIKRILPLRHPFSRSLVISAINDVKGVGRQTPTESSPDIFVPVIDGFPLYEQYEVKVEFKPPQYNLRPDNTIYTTSRDYINYLGNPVIFNYSNEWTRYLDWQETPSSEVITSKYGQMFFHTSDNALPGAADTRQAAQYQAMPYQALPDSVVKMVWYQVPLTFITSPYSYLMNCPLGVINQFDWFDPQGDGRPMFPAGSLRWGGATHKKYLPPSPPALGAALGFELGLDSAKLCNIEMTFFRTTRQRFATDLPAAADVGANVNRNWLVKGWNLQPWLARPNQYFYSHFVDTATSGTSYLDKTKWYPHHNSFPFELFFTNPDCPQPERANMLEVKP